MGSFTIKNLANGQLPNAKGTLYTATSVTVIIKSIILVNTNTSAETINLYHKTATSRRLIPKDLSLAASNSLLLDAPITLTAGDLIEGDTTTASQVDFVISGVEYA